MNKRHLHHFWRKFRLLKPWYFLIIALISGAICVTALRSNNQRMVDLRSNLYTVDQKDGDVAGALNKLRSYVYAHMNTALSTGNDTVYPPVQLKYTYDRLVTAESARVAESNARIYNDAQNYCEQLNSTDFSGRNRVPCISQYVTSHGTKAHAIPDAQYKFDFVSPVWSPDLAGWSMVVTIFSLICAIVLLIARRWFKQNVA